jgi:hypothetical protein
MTQRLLLGFLISVLAITAAPAVAEPTEVAVRVLSRDAKFVGTSMGGVRITLRDRETDEVLARGLTTGGTGDTAKIMHEDRGRRATMADDSAAAYQTTLDLDRARLVEVEAYGPLAQPQAAHTVTSTQWVVPGRDLTGGDGWVLEMPGFVVDVETPSAHTKLSEPGDSVRVEAAVMMMCGCPIEPNGLWDANDYEIAMTVEHNGQTMDEIGLEYAGQTSRFAGEIPLQGAGVYQVTVHAYDPETGNTGVDRTTFIVP